MEARGFEVAPDRRGWDLWLPDVLIPLGHGQAERLWTVVGVPGFSRLIGAWMIPSRAGHDVLGGMNQVLAQIGGVPRTAVWDQDGCIARWRQCERSGEWVLGAQRSARLAPQRRGRGR